MELDLQLHKIKILMTNNSNENLDVSVDYSKDVEPNSTEKDGEVLLA